MDLEDVRWEGMDWIDLAKDRERCPGLVIAVMKFGFHKIRGISWVAEKLFASDEGFCCTELVSYLSFYFPKVFMPCTGTAVPP